MEMFMSSLYVFRHSVGVNETKVVMYVGIVAFNVLLPSISNAPFFHADVYYFVLIASWRSAAIANAERSCHIQWSSFSGPSSFSE
jgi:hypothetical protein